MEFGTTSDTGWIGDVRELAHELSESSAAFVQATESVSDALFVALRSMPRELAPRSFARFERRDAVLIVDLRVAEQDLAGLTADEQRRLLGPQLLALVSRGTKSRTAAWSQEERSLIRVEFERMLSKLNWLPAEV
ncbi:hypothetical protein [Agromyces soli]|uniref:Uncharacterized protein n=1 Tax=Agromyces soli TaxID=659012 RepID=A0ABY4AVU9_9MICO|nr:hypothetical protein [Agromyces soli]UOE26954.1 hypothetical protein MTP13_03980 [Agromyces soli]